MTFNTGCALVDARLSLQEGVSNINQSMSDNFLIRCFFLDMYPGLVSFSECKSENPLFEKRLRSNVKINKTGANRYHVTIGNKWSIVSINGGQVKERCGTFN